MPTRISEAHWTGGLKAGKGVMEVGSGAYKGSYSFGTRFEEARGSNPEELIGAAHAGCFSMALSDVLEQSGHKPENIDTKAKVHLDAKNGGFRIARIELETQAHVPGLNKADFEKFAQTAKTNCPVSQALKGVEISLNAQLK